MTPLVTGSRRDVTRPSRLRRFKFDLESNPGLRPALLNLAMSLWVDQVRTAYTYLES